MHSGGPCKEDPYEKIYIQAPREEAEVIFYNMFGHAPDRVTCTCCGEDYSISHESTFEKVSGFHRNCDYGKDGYVESQKPGYKMSPEETEVYIKANPQETYKTIEQYIQDPAVSVVTSEEIYPQWRVGEVRKSGYVWID